MIKKQKKWEPETEFPYMGILGPNTLLVKTWLKEEGQNEILAVSKSTHYLFSATFYRIEIDFFGPKRLPKVKNWPK